MEENLILPSFCKLKFVDCNKPIYYEFTACPAAEFAKKHGLTDRYRRNRE